MHRTAGATEVVIWSARRFAILHELRGEPEWDLPELLGKLSPVDLVLVEGFKRDAFPKLEIHRAANGKPLLHPDDPHIVAVACDSAAAGREGAGDRSQRHRGDRRSLLSMRCRSTVLRGAPDGAAHRRLLCVLRPAAAGRRHGAADRRADCAGGRDRARAACAARAGACCRRRDGAGRPAAVRQFRGRRLRGAPRRSRSRWRHTAPHRRPVDRRRPCRSRARAGRGHPHLHRRADAGGRRHRLHAGGRDASRATA